MNAPPRTEWIDANQRVLVAEFDRLRSILDDDDLEWSSGYNEAERAALLEPAAIDTLTETFGLSLFERDILLLAAGVEMDAELAALCGKAVGRPDRPWLTVGLALSALEEPHWSAVAPSGPLRHWRLVEVDDEPGLGAARMRVDERILHYLAGVEYLDPRIDPMVRRVPVPSLMAEAQRRLADQIAGAIHSRASIPLIQLNGDDLDGQKDVAAMTAEILGLGLYVLADGDFPAGVCELQALARLWQREAAIAGAALLITQSEGSPEVRLRQFAERIRGLVIIASTKPIQLEGNVLRYTVDKPDSPEQKRLWQAVLGDAADRLDGALDAIASQYRLSVRGISTAASLVAPQIEETPSKTALPMANINVTAPELGALAQRIHPGACWNDLVLPESQLSALRQISSHIRHRLRVYHDWGFAEKGARGLGVSALFCGESGTGKTMAAEVLASSGDFEIVLYRIDLSAVVSKYIGETERNLKKVFDAAEETGAILLFDEADALFGKRSEVKDSHDRYANIEVSYLLQRMEAYRGLAILTTNQRASLDTAFLRRLRFVIHFPFPDATQREAIWRGIFPSHTPLHGVDFRNLSRLNVAGGGIRNIAMNAAFFAAEANSPVTMAHLHRAAHLEAAKSERAISDAETRGWV